MPDMSKHEDAKPSIHPMDALNDAYTELDRVKKAIATKGLLVKGKSWDADDGFAGAADHLSDALATIGHALHRMREEGIAESRRLCAYEDMTEERPNPLAAE